MNINIHHIQLGILMGKRYDFTPPNLIHRYYYNSRTYIHYAHIRTQSTHIPMFMIHKNWSRFEIQASSFPVHKITFLTLPMFFFVCTQPLPPLFSYLLFRRLSYFFLLFARARRLTRSVYDHSNVAEVTIRTHS